jgi:hypothetical protein
MYGDGEWDEDDVEQEQKNGTNQPSPPLYCRLLFILYSSRDHNPRRGRHHSHIKKNSPAERLKSTRKAIALAQETLYP